jgi:hypothetical protein
MIGVSVRGWSAADDITRPGAQTVRRAVREWVVHIGPGYPADRGGDPLR